MHVRKFRAATLKEAFAQAQKELGHDAVLLHQRNIQTAGGNGSVRQNGVEITVGVDSISPEPVQPFFPTAMQAGRASTSPTAVSTKGMQDGMHEPLSRSEFESLRKEILYIRKLLQRQNAVAGHRDVLHIWQSALAESGLRVDLAEELLFGLEEVLTASALQHPEMVAATLRQRLQSLLPPVQGGLRPGKPGSPLVFVLVGPTGVGKTTTIAKLAAHFSVQRRIPIALITADTFRVGAVSQLRTYSELIQAPLEVAYTPAELAGHVAAHQDKAIIFVDTPGRSPTDHDQLEVLRSFVGALEKPHLQIAVACGTQLSDARRIVERFSTPPPEAILLTKLDETAMFGSAGSLIAETGLPVSYFTTGQRVPEDIRLADNDELVNRVLKNCLENVRAAQPSAEDAFMPMEPFHRTPTAFERLSHAT